VENVVIDFFSSGHHRSVAGVTYLAASLANLVGTLDLPGELPLLLVSTVGSRSIAPDRFT
jgi:hypothetical protein